MIIPSKDSPRLIEALRSVNASAKLCPSIAVEVIVVDSSLALRPFSAHMTFTHVDLVLIHKDLNRLAARLEGIAHASGDWILSLDSDQTIHPNLISTIYKADSPSIAFPEFPPGPRSTWDRWASLVTQANRRTERDFQKNMSLDIPIVPRAYRANLLRTAISELKQSMQEKDFSGVPTRHEDTILFSYFLRANHLTPSGAVGFSSSPIFHSVPSISESARRYLRYGYDLGSESRKVRHGQLRVSPEAWEQVYRVDVLRLTRYFSRGLGVNVSGLVYDSFCGSAYLVGFLKGFLFPGLKSRPPGGRP